LSVSVESTPPVTQQTGFAAFSRVRLPLCRSEKSAYLDAAIQEVIRRHAQPTSGQVRRLIETRLGPDGLKLFPVSTVCERLKGWR
jgi:hypothetical protein